MIFQLYKCLTIVLVPFIYGLLLLRVRSGKADSARMAEYMGFSPDMARPEGDLFWVHAASVGEAQSALRLIDDILDRYDRAHVMITTGTLTSARLLAGKLPDRAFHRFYPLDQAGWVSRFLDFWEPDFAIWLESELWPNMLQELSKRHVPAALVNARMSQRSAARWAKIAAAKDLFKPFVHVFAQTRGDADAFATLGHNAEKISVSGNVKYSAKPLGYSAADYEALRLAIADRSLWLYASTHQGEESLAVRVHADLKAKVSSDILTIIVPRHPERRGDIAETLSDQAVMFRGEGKQLPDATTEIYVADTLGELGLFYALSQVAVIGRSFSDDGGGGHNPIEAAQLDCTILSGAHVKYQQEIFDELAASKAAELINDPDELSARLVRYFENPDDLQRMQSKAKDFVAGKDRILSDVESRLWSLIENALTQKEDA